MQHTQIFHSPPTFDHVIVDGILRVLIDQETGEPFAVQDAATGVAAKFLYSKGAIANAERAARAAWQSTADLF
jgi:hypothetical protein